MNRIINLGKVDSALKEIETIKNNDYVPFDIRIINSHLLDLNNIIGMKVFKKDALYVNSRTLWEIMQPIGGRGKHHYHELSPKEILEALLKMKNALEVVPSYDNRYLIITLATISNGTNIAIVLEKDAQIIKDGKKHLVTKVVTMYPKLKK